MSNPPTIMISADTLPTMTPTRLLIIKLGDTMPHMRDRLGDFEDWISHGLRHSGKVLDIEVCDPRQGDVLPPVHANVQTDTGLAGVVVTGSHAMVTDREGWSEHTACWLRDAVANGLPVLGICYGHQLLAHAMGGTVTNHPGGLEVGTKTIWLTDESADDPLFGPLPSHWPVQVAHAQSVAELPPGAVLLAHNRFEPHHAYRIGDCAWGVQFHPEFDLDITRAYIEHLSGRLVSQGESIHALNEAVQPTPDAASLLTRFALLACDAAASRPRA